MRTPMTYFLLPILLVCFSDSLAEPPDSTSDVIAADVAGPKEIKSVLDLFRPGDEVNWPIQRTDRWCWAASAEIIMLSHGRTSWKQCIQADDAFPGKTVPRTCCDDPESPLCNRTGWPHFEYYDFNHAQTSASLPWEQLTDEIDNDRPVAVAVKYVRPLKPDVIRGGHMGVIAGYKVLPSGEKAILTIDSDGFHVGMWALYDEIYEDSSDIARHWRSYYDIYPYP